MPSRAPSYYHWAMDKPCTTNQTYGYFHRESTDLTAKKPTGPKGPFDYTRPFSNSGFFPQISWKGRLTSATQARPLRPSKDYNPPSSINRFDINKGYTMGHSPVYERVAKPEQPVGCMLNRSASAPAAYRYPEPKGKDIFLWHTLSGCLVHAKNYPPVEQEA